MQQKPNKTGGIKVLNLQRGMEMTCIQKKKYCRIYETSLLHNWTVTTHTNTQSRTETHNKKKTEGKQEKHTTKLK